MGIGRVGGILGPLVVGAALAAGWSAGTVFYALAVPMLLSAVIVLYLGRRSRRQAQAVPEPAKVARQTSR